MLARAKSRFVRISPYKLRPLVDGIRGKRVDAALAWLGTRATERVKPVFKALSSAWANAQNKNASLSDPSSVVVSHAVVDQGPTYKYHRPGAMGRSVMQRRRLSHIEIGVDSKTAPAKQER